VIVIRAPETGAFDCDNKKARFLKRAFFRLGQRSVRQAPARTTQVPKVHIGQSVAGFFGRDSVFDLLNVVRQHAFGAGYEFVADFGPLFERTEAIHLDGREVGEYIAPTLIRFNEAKTFGIVKPFDSACGHTVPPVNLFTFSGSPACDVKRTFDG
jgi:hypothetical protein